MTDDSIAESPQTDNLKKCSKCGKWKLATPEFFISQQNRKSKWRSECRECNRAFRTRYYAASAEERREARRVAREARHAAKEVRPGQQKCSKCGEWKPATGEFFAVRKDAESGLRGECLACYRRRKRLWRDRNRDKELERVRNWHKKNPDVLRKGRAANADKIRARHRKWRLSNPDKLRTYSNNRRARVLQAEGTHTAEDVQAQYNNQRGKCWYCGKKVGKKYDVDHRIPLSRGGSNAPENLVIACPRCNRSKHDRMPWEWSDRLL